MPMKHYLYLFAVFFALFIFSCGEVSDSGGSSSISYCNGVSYKTSEKFCFENEIYLKCGGAEYDPHAFECINNKLSPMCSGTPYDTTKNFCFEEKIYPICGVNTYNPKVEGCLDGKISPMCSGTPYDTIKDFCFDNAIYSKCGDNIYYPNVEGCLESKIYPKCFETLYDSTRSFCFENKLYFLCNGQKYYPGEKGCLEGSVSPVCGTGKTPYNDTTSFCFENAVYLKCKKNNEYFKYFPNIEDCFDGKTYPICGSGRTVYDSTANFCFENVVYSKCGGNKYFPNLEFCFESKVEKKCKDKPYNINNEFCFENAIYSKCNGKNYNPTTQLCFNNIETRCPNSKYDDEFCKTEAGISVSYRICGSESYKSEGKFCSSGEIYNKCGNKEYDPSKEFCYDNDYYPRCGGNMYSPRNDFCFGNKVYTKCESDQSGQNGKTYNPKESFCYKNKLDTLCNGVEFKTDEEFCSRLYDFKVHPICNGNKDYNPKERVCYNNTLYFICSSGEFSINKSCSPLYQLCGNTIYDVATHFCDEKIIYQKCGGKTYPNPSNKFCLPDYTDPNGTPYDKCQIPDGFDELGRPKYKPIKYDPVTQICKDLIGIEDKVLPPKCQNLNTATEFCCFGKKYLITDPYFCYNDELYPKCGGKAYNPIDTGCFEGNPYQRCSIDSIVGPCVDKTLKRCRQLGSGPNQTIDPLPEMTCNNNGSITGRTKPDPLKPDGYAIAQIGNQVWLAENLKYDYGDNACYGDNSANCSKYGRLYDWATAMALDPTTFNSQFYNLPATTYQQGPCPSGFYLPHNEDWKKLIDYVGGVTIAGGRLKSTTGWDNNGNGIDAYGFNALPGGYYSDLIAPVAGSNYFEEGIRTMWWSITDIAGGANAYHWTAISSDSEVRNFHQSKRLHKAYVRCLLYYKE